MGRRAKRQEVVHTNRQGVRHSCVESILGRSTSEAWVRL